MQERDVPVIVSYPEFFPPVYAIDLLPEGFVGEVIKIQAPYPIASVTGVFVWLRHRPQPLADGNPVGEVDRMFPFVPVLRHRFLTSFPKIVPPL